MERSEVSDKQVVKSTAIFICAGDLESFATYSISHLRNNFDIIINFFGIDSDKRHFLMKYSDIFFQQKTTKFLSLKSIYTNNPTIFDKYDYIICFDDDAIPISGNIENLIKIAKQLNMSIISPSHDRSGKISWKIMQTYPGNHVVRFTNFVEMTFPIFKVDFLKQYLDHYTGECCGYGNDWWYLNILNPHKNPFACGICDDVRVKNPFTNKDHINSYMPHSERKQEWTRTKSKHTLKEWKQMTSGYVHLSDDNRLIFTPISEIP